MLTYFYSILFVDDLQKNNPIIVSRYSAERLENIVDVIIVTPDSTVDLSVGNYFRHFVAVI